MTWEDANNVYLAASLTWLRARLDARAELSRATATRSRHDRDDGRTAAEPQAEPAPTLVIPAAASSSPLVATQAEHRRRWRRRVSPPPTLPPLAITSLRSGPAPGACAEAFSAPAAGQAADDNRISTARQDAIDAAAARRAEAADTGGRPPALLSLAEQLGLTDFERDTLLLCVAPAVDPSITLDIAQLQGGPAAGAPTFELALHLFDDARWDVLSPERGLRLWRLVEPLAGHAQPLTTAALRADERIVNLVKGLNHLDDRLAGVFSQRPDPAGGVALPPSLQAAADALVRAALAPTTDGRFGVLELIGPDAEGAELLAVRALGRLDRLVYRTTPSLLAAAAAELATLARLWQRETLLLPVALLIDAVDADLDDPVIGDPVRRFADAQDGVVVLAVREIWNAPDGRIAVVDSDRPTPAEQRDLWAEMTGEPRDGTPATLAAQFRLSLPTLHRVASAAQAGAALAGSSGDVTRTLWDGCLAATRPRLESLAQRTRPRARWGDLVMPADQLHLLQQLCGQVARQSQVMTDWGFADRLERGGGITALFAGPSGTGKTFAAEVLASELCLDLYRVDLSAVVNKYIGETEKNLRRVFDAAEDGGALLFFDEADALFGRRSEVHDSHDRYANIEVNYLLQRMEAYHGLAVLATNLRGALDPAFLRRLRFVVEFEVPDPDLRRQLWSRAFPPAVPVGDLDLDLLAKLAANGAAIQQIALGAAFLAANEGGAVETGTVLRAARTEFRKLGLPLPPLPATGPEASRVNHHRAEAHA